MFLCYVYPVRRKKSVTIQGNYVYVCVCLSEEKERGDYAGLYVFPTRFFAPGNSMTAAAAAVAAEIMLDPMN